jgi:hypothetical protein
MLLQRLHSCQLRVQLIPLAEPNRRVQPIPQNAVKSRIP